jgi:hypothetical protein
MSDRIDHVLRPSGVVMLDRQKVEAILSRRFPGVTPGQIAAAANAILGLADEWEEVGGEQGFHVNVLVRCPDTCALARAAEGGTELRLLRRRTEGSTR